MLSKRRRRKLKKMLTGPVCICGFIFLPLAEVSAYADTEPTVLEEARQHALMDERFDDDLALTFDAEKLTRIESNVLLQGEVVVRYNDVVIYADTAIVNQASRDIEAIGRVRFYDRDIKEMDLDLWEYENLQKNPDNLVEHLGITTLPTGAKKIRARVSRLRYAWESDHIIGNLTTGMMQAKNFYSHNDHRFFVRGEYAERSPGGRLTVKKADVSTCNHFLGCTEHYCLSAGMARLTPNRKDFDANLDKETLQQVKNYRKYWITLSDNIFAKIYDVPVFWFPALALPPLEEIPKWIRIGGGYSSDFGVYGHFSKRFQYPENPDFYAYTQPGFSFFTKRGFGISDETVVKTDNSWTQISAFGVLDRHPNGVNDWQKRRHRDFSRFDIPKERYELRLEHVTHVTPRLDIRGRFNALSDINFLEEFYPSRRNSDALSSFFSLDYQFERFIPSLYVRARPNNWSPETLSLPEMRIDLPRQHLLGGLYYQGQNSVNWLHMKWRNFDYGASGSLPNTNFEDPKKYDSFRWDMLHMFHYPIRLDWLNIIPRAGIRLTAYSETSKTAVSDHDLQYYKWSQQPDMSMSLANYVFQDGVVPTYARLYDDKGGAKLRVLGELGLEMNTKISRTWNHVKNAFWELDGLRHVFVPYLNYNYNPPSNVKPQNIYFFDEIDRYYGEQHFVRLGFQNRLQTRRGPFYDERIHDWLSLEAYFDIHIQDPKRYGHFGDLGAILNFNPFPNLKLTSAILFNPSCNDNSYYGTIRQGKIQKRVGFGGKFLSAWNTRLSYEFMKDFRIFGAFNFQNNYYQRSQYSMGSSLTSVISGTEFSNQYFRYQEIRGGLEFPIPIDDRTFGALEVAYDIESALLRDARVRLTRNFHCWDVSLEAASRERRNYWGGKRRSNEVMLTIGLSALPEAKFTLR